MFKALHENTGIVWPAFEVLGTYKIPKKEKWICCQIHKYPVVHVKLGHKKNGTLVASHFRSLTDHFCPGESDEHWNLKIQIAEAIKNKQLLFSFRKENIQYKVPEDISLEEYIEVRKNNRQADVLFLSDDYDSFLGFGLVIEIQVSEKIESLESKAIDWIRNKYSITWVDRYPESGILEIKYPSGLYFDIVRECNHLKWNKNKKKYRGGS